MQITHRKGYALLYYTYIFIIPSVDKVPLHNSVWCILKGMNSAAATGKKERSSHSKCTITVEMKTYAAFYMRKHTYTHTQNSIHSQNARGEKKILHLWMHKRCRWCLLFLLLFINAYVREERARPICCCCMLMAVCICIAAYKYICIYDTYKCACVHRHRNLTMT